MDDPLILTLALDPEAEAHLDALRDRHFPPDLNRVPAHVTLFNHLPGDRAPAVFETVAAVAADTPPPRYAADGIVRLGRRGCAVRLRCAAVEPLRRRIGAPFALIDQDRGKRMLHATVQNKAGPEEAARTFEHLRATFQPFEGTATGLRLWWYRGGPWEAAGAYAFEGSE